MLFIYPILSPQLRSGPPFCAFRVMKVLSFSPLLLLLPFLYQCANTTVFTQNTHTLSLAYAPHDDPPYCMIWRVGSHCWFQHPIV